MKGSVYGGHQQAAQLRGRPGKRGSLACTGHARVYRARHPRRGATHVSVLATELYAHDRRRTLELGLGDVVVFPGLGYRNQPARPAVGGVRDLSADDSCRGLGGFSAAAVPGQRSRLHQPRRQGVVITGITSP
jgi:hypothetical protein